MRDAAINLRAMPKQRDLIDHAAKLLGKNRSDFMLDAACERAQAVVLDQVFFRLDKAKFIGTVTSNSTPKVISFAFMVSYPVCVSRLRVLLT